MRPYEIPQSVLEIERELYQWVDGGNSLELPQQLKLKIDKLKQDGPPAIDDLWKSLEMARFFMKMLEEEEENLAYKRAKIKLFYERWRELMLEIVCDCFGGSVKGVHRTYITRERNGKLELVIKL